MPSHFSTRLAFWHIRWRPHFLLLLGLPLLLSTWACRKDATLWDVNAAVPLVKASLGMRDMVPGNLIKTNSDNSLSAVFQDSIASIRLDRLSALPDTIYQKTFTLQTVKLSNQRIVYPLSLGALARKAGLTGSLILLAHGTYQPIPAIGPISSGSVDVDANQFFRTATIKSGWLDLQIVNGLPIDVTNVSFELYNKTSNTLVLTKLIPLIPANSTVNYTEDLSGKTVDGDLTLKLQNLSSPGTPNAVLVDTNNAIQITMGIRDLSVESATAIFPAQNLIDTKSETTYDMGGNLLKYGKLHAGNMHVELVSTLRDSIHFDYKIPNVSKGGQAVEIKETLPPASANGTIRLQRDLDLAGYDMDLTGKDGTKFNTIFFDIVGSIDSTGKIATLSLNDSIYLYYSFTNLTTEEAVGYFKDTTFNVKGSAPLTLFDNVLGGALDLKDAHFGLTIKNGIGVDGLVRVNKLVGHNTHTATQVAVSGNSIAAPVTIARAARSPFTPSFATLSLDGNNSNVKQLIEAFPNKADFDIDIAVNPNGNVSNYHDFVLYGGSIAGYIDVEVPLSFRANQLVVADTTPFTLGNSTELERLTEATLLVNATNGFPLDADLQLYFLNAGGTRLDSLFSPNLVLKSAALDAQNLAGSATKSAGSIKLDQAKLGRLKAATQVVLMARLNTLQGSLNANAPHPTLYEQNKIAIQLLAKLTYGVHN